MIDVIVLFGSVVLMVIWGVGEEWVRFTDESLIVRDDDAVKERKKHDVFIVLDQ